MGTPHPIWGTVRDNVHDSRRAQLKCRILTGTYNLQSNRAVFNQYRVDPTCKLCDEQPETRQHFLAECEALAPERDRFRHQISQITLELNIDTRNPETLVKLILDSTWIVKNPDVIADIELASRILIHKLHYKRVRLLSEVERQHGFGDCG